MNAKNNPGKRKFVYRILFLTIILLMIILIFIRNISPRQIDDVNPNRLCEEIYADRSQVLMIVPLLDNISIADNKHWCEYILRLNKSLGMHGVYHTPEEFNELRNDSYILLGMEEFKKCFGFYPTIFEAPELVLNRENRDLLRDRGFEVRGRTFNVFHKVYHCVDFDKNSYLVKLNKFIDLV